MDLYFKKRLAREHDVFFCPAMDLPAMRAGESRTIQLGAVPGRFFNGLASGREFAGGRTANQDPFNDGAVRGFQGRLEIKGIH